MKISFLDLNRQYEAIKNEIDQSIKRVIGSQYFVLGKELEAFEKEFSAFIGVRYGVGVSNGTTGLTLALLALGIGKGDEVITPVNSFIATALAITRTGATPVFVDCDPDTYQMNVSQIKNKITKKTKAILPVHLYGAPCKIDVLKKIAKNNKLYLVEDACQAHGAIYKGKKLGSFGDLGIFSFYPGKNLGAYGDGGIVVTNKKSLYEKLRSLRNYGQSKKYFHKELGVNSRLDEIQAAILRVKLKYLNRWNTKRIAIADMYKKQLKEYKTQVILKGGKSNWHLLIIEIGNRDGLQKHLLKNGISTIIHYPLPIHLQDAYKHYGYKKGDFPIAEALANRILSLPIYPELKEEEIFYIAKTIKTFPRL